MKNIICWFSGGITSAVACKLAIQKFGLNACRIVFIDTYNEHEDTYRFSKDCEKWYGIQIEHISEIGITYDSIQNVWRHHNSLNVAFGAICSTQLKRKARERFEKENNFSVQIFGFEYEKKEMRRAKNLKLNHGHTNPYFPLIENQLTKKDCIRIVQQANIEIPESYKLGFHNNNCLQTGCVQGGIGYWQKMQKMFPEKFEAMAQIEHELTEAKGQPVTMLKDQRKHTPSPLFGEPEPETNLIFLKHNPKYPHIRTINDLKGRPPQPLTDCNGFCGTNDLLENKTESEINFQTNLF